jgi:hypothetical protein
VRHLQRLKDGLRVTLRQNAFVRRWELWEKDWTASDEEGGGHQSFFPEDNHQARQIAQDAGETLVWETNAKGYNDAMRAMYRYRGWGEYNPIFLQPDGTPMPEDEDDDYPEPGGES